MTGEIQDDPQSSEEVVIQSGKERVQGDMDKTDLWKPTKQNQRRLTPSICTQIKEVPTGQHEGGSICSLS